MYIVSARNFSVFLKSKTILNNINCEIPDNSITVFLGKSGSGKSTFLKCINRINDYTNEFSYSGSIIFDDVNIYDARINMNYLRRRIGMVFQKPNPFPMSIFDNVAFGLKFSSYNKEEIKDIVFNSLKLVGLYDDVIDRIYDSALDLSGGQQQRLCIARSIAVKPEVLLMDEPCSALDIASNLHIEQLILELKKEYPILMVSHSVDQAKRIADYIGLFDSGSLMRFGKLEEIVGFF